MAHEEAPPRLVSGAGAADFRLKRALRELQSRAPSDSDRAELERRLAATIGAGTTATKAKSKSAAGLGLLAWLKLGAAAAALGAVAAGAIALRSRPAPSPVIARAVPTARPVVSVPAEPTPAAEVAAPAEASSSSSVASTAKPDRNAELRLLKAAQAALGESPSRALALTSEHAQRFPRSSLGQERDLLRITALVRLGRTAEAQTLAQRFQQRYPKSPYAHRIAAALHE